MVKGGTVSSPNQTGAGNYFMINLHESMGLGSDQTRNIGSAVRLKSVARHVTDWATQPGEESCYEGTI